LLGLPSLEDAFTAGEEMNSVTVDVRFAIALDDAVRDG
jgi:hypothetical protein